MTAEIRSGLNILLGGGAAIYGVVSLWAALDASSTWPFASHEKLGWFILGFWALVPPVYFWIDWVWFCSYMQENDNNRDIAKHTHDLSRNIWIGLLAVLAVLFKLPFPGAGH